MITRSTPINSGTALLSASRNAGTYTSLDLPNSGKGVELYVNVTVVGVGGSIVVTILGKDPASGAYVSIMASASLVATGIVRLRVFPGLGAIANVVGSDTVPPTFQVQAVVSVAACTFSVGWVSVP